MRPQHQLADDFVLPTDFETSILHNLSHFPFNQDWPILHMHPLQGLQSYEYCVQRTKQRPTYVMCDLNSMTATKNYNKLLQDTQYHKVARHYATMNALREDAALKRQYRWQFVASALLFYSGAQWHDICTVQSRQTYLAQFYMRYKTELARRRMTAVYNWKLFAVTIIDKRLRRHS